MAALGERRTWSPSSPPPGVPTTKIKAAMIKSRTKAETSTMPPGLLNTLTKEQILDLLAYLKSGGKIEAHKH